MAEIPPSKIKVLIAGGELFSVKDDGCINEFIVPALAPVLATPPKLVDYSGLEAELVKNLSSYEVIILKGVGEGGNDQKLNQNVVIRQKLQEFVNVMGGLLLLPMAEGRLQILRWFDLPWSKFEYCSDDFEFNPYCWMKAGSKSMPKLPHFEISTKAVQLNKVERKHRIFAVNPEEGEKDDPNSVSTVIACANVGKGYVAFLSDVSWVPETFDVLKWIVDYYLALKARDSIAAPTQKCSVCGSTVGENAGLNACGRCGTRLYCGVVCQKSDWPTHKPSCVPRAGS